MKMSDYASSPPDGISVSKPAVGGWLRYICYFLMVLSPLKSAQLIWKTSDGFPTVIYSAIIITSVIAGGLTWSISRSAFLWLRIHLAARLLYGFWQVHLGFKLSEDLADHAAAQQAFLSAAANILLVLLLFLYFRISSRVNETFGRNI